MREKERLDMEVRDNVFRKERARHRGTVIKFCKPIGYGYVRPDSGGKNLFISDKFNTASRNLEVGQLIEFDIAAVDVTPVGYDPLKRFHHRFRHHQSPKSGFGRQGGSGGRDGGYDEDLGCYNRKGKGQSTSSTSKESTSSEDEDGGYRSEFCEFLDCHGDCKFCAPFHKERDSSKHEGGTSRWKRCRYVYCTGNCKYCAPSRLKERDSRE